MGTEKESTDFGIAEAFDELLSMGNFSDEQTAKLSLFLRERILRPLIEVLVKASEVKNRDQFIAVMTQVTAVAVEFRETDTRATRKAARAASRAKRQLEVQKETDSVTGLLNKQGFLDRVSNVLRDRRIHHSTIVYIDLRGFKDWNDRFSHLAGDFALRVFAAFLEGHVYGKIARMGGDEYAILLTNVTCDQVLTTVRMLQHSIDVFPWASMVTKLVEQEESLNPLEGNPHSIDPIYIDMGAVCLSVPMGEHQGRKTVGPVAQLYVYTADVNMQRIKDIAHHRNLLRSTYRVASCVLKDDEFLAMSPAITSEDESQQ